MNRLQANVFWKTLYFDLLYFNGRTNMTLSTILIVVLILILVGVIPTWPHSRSWGYKPGFVFGIALVVLLILILLGRI